MLKLIVRAENEITWREYIVQYETNVFKTACWYFFQNDSRAFDGVFRSFSNEVTKSAVTSPNEADDVVFHVGHETVLRISARKESNASNFPSIDEHSSFIHIYWWKRQ